MIERILFMHIHKTAGTAMSKQLFSHWPGHQICPARFECQVLRIDPVQLSQFTIFFGHITPAALAPVVGPLKYMTILREPRTRLLSAYFFWKDIAARSQNNGFFRRLRDLSLLEFLQSNDPLIWRATWNVQARLIAGGRYGATNDCRTNVFGPQGSPEEISRAAMSGLDRFELVGIAEHYLDTMALAFRLQGDEIQPPAPELHNVGANKPEGGYEPFLADAHIAAALERLTDIDVQIYEAASARLSRQLRHESRQV
jgi:hypothetical protein